MKLSDYVAKFLARHTGHVFAGNGGCVVHLLDSLENNRRIRLVPCENEQGAAIAAEAYWRSCGKIGVAVATSGPGMINLMQGIACAYFDSIPSLYISGAAPTGHLKGKSKVRQKGFQEMDVVEITKPLTKYAVLLKDAKKIRYELEKLVYKAFEGRPGPVLMDLPDDLQRADINVSRLEGFVPAVKKYTVSKAVINKITTLIKTAKRPVVIVGGGVKLANAQRELKRFLKRSGLAYATTWATIDMFLDDEPNLIGNFGVSANRAGNFAVQNADLIISLGSRLDTHEAGSNAVSFAPKAKKVMVDIDEAELDKKNKMKLDVKVNCEIKTFLKAMNAARIETAGIEPWLKRIRDWKSRYPVCLESYYRQKSKVNPYVFMNELSRQTTEDDIIITDAGATLTWTMQAYKIRSRQKLFSAFNHSPMGYALPASIGAQFAAPDRCVVCIIGDGGMQMNIQELETVVYNRLPVKIFLINNGGYCIMRQTQDTWLDGRHVAADPSSGLGFPDIQKIGRAYGIKVFEINSHKNLNANLRKVLEHKGPILCEVKLKKTERITPKLTFGRPLEDLWPLLPREELKANMSAKI